ncbi:hypothetical protein TNCV_917861 [Trichonephila clavipes]|nr:hypothetical protein TNCV_917861 [Trichonephila clavipes]
MVYAGISIDGRTDIHNIRNAALGNRCYKDEALRLIEVPYDATILNNFMLMNNNFRAHRVNLMDGFLFGEEIIGMASLFVEHESSYSELEPNMNPESMFLTF